MGIAVTRVALPRMMAPHLAVMLVVLLVCAVSSSIGPAWGVAVVTDLDKANIDEFISEHVSNTAS